MTTSREKLLADVADAIVKAARDSYGDTVEAEQWCALAAEYALAVFEANSAELAEATENGN